MFNNAAASMLYGCTPSTSLSTSERASIDLLSSDFKRLITDDGLPDVRSNQGHKACQDFLGSIEHAAKSLKVPAAGRAYRDDFSVNYTPLFPDNARHYRVDVLEASIEQHQAIWVNGDQFELSLEAMGFATSLHNNWGQLGALLDRWVERKMTSKKPTKVELSNVLSSLDEAWANFERKYILELMGIETWARQLVTRAVDLEAQLQIAHKMGISQDANLYQQLQKSMIESVGVLNSVANTRRKGRDDLGNDILNCALATLKRGGDASVAHVLAKDVVESFDAMCAYLRQVGTCVERVDPHLCNNVGLVARLEDWESCWEVGSRYLKDAPLYDAICDVLTEIRSAQKIVPALGPMIDDCDVELFLVLPRFITLCCLAKPEGRHTALLRSLVPHWFEDESLLRPCSGLRALTVHLAQMTTLIESECGDSPLRDASGWELMIKRAIHGSSDACDAVLTLEVQRRLEVFMRDIECWSLELQRHCPDDWNQCSAVLVQCLTTTVGEKKVIAHLGQV